MKGLFARKPVEKILAASEEGGSLKRLLGPATLVALGVGAIIGAGIFTLTGVAATNAGPAPVYSFVLAASGCGFAGLCYSEFATMITPTRPWATPANHNGALKTSNR